MTVPAGQGDALRQHLRIGLLTALAMIAFAANSVICRYALGLDLIDPASFTTVRVAAAALTLGTAAVLRHRRMPRFSNVDKRGAVALFLYAIFFSFGYASLSTGTGALILFGAVQMTMFAVALREGEHFSALSWAGLAAAFGGLVWLVLPGVTAPDPLGAACIALSGIAWGVFSLVARGAGDPVETNAVNFILCVPLAAMVSLLFAADGHAEAHGYVLAVASGAVASGAGYVIWYAALKGLTATRAATVQLSVPAIAAIGGVVLLGEAVTLRLLVASVAMLGGVAIVLAQRARPKRVEPDSF